MHSVFWIGLERVKSSFQSKELRLIPKRNVLDPTPLPNLKALRMSADRRKRPRVESGRSAAAKSSSDEFITFKNFPKMKFQVVDGRIFPHHLFGPLVIVMDPRTEEREDVTVVDEKDEALAAVRRKATTVTTLFARMPSEDGAVAVQAGREYVLKYLQVKPVRVRRRRAATDGKEEDVKQEPDD
jgi:hypothetical protein